MARMGMVIDLQRCVGCGACALACKAENNTRNRGNGQSYNWADFLMKTEGTFPNVTHWVMPVLCNHCSNAPCVEVCPAEPKAMFKTPNGITMHSDDDCIGCRACQEACPYSSRELSDTSLDGAAYSVISYNPKGSTQPQWEDRTSAIPGGTASAAETAKRTGTTTPAMNAFVGGDVGPIRISENVEKCTFCFHRTSKGLQPACVDACPAHARIFGDQDDADAEIARALKAQKPFRLKEDKGTRPNVLYVGKYTARG